MKSKVEVKKATYYGYSIRRGAAPENEVYYSLGFRPNGLYDSRGQFAVVTSLNGAWHDICERRKNCKVGEDFIITLESDYEKYV